MVVGRLWDSEGTMWCSVFAAAAALTISIGAANADSIQVYNISGTETESGPFFGGTISSPADGTLVLDYTLGLVDYALINPGFQTF
jgi:hypothetical protein